MFGTGDAEHGHLIVFPGATWTEIAMALVPYLEAQWNPERLNAEYLLPWPKYEFKP
jgi:hypothetical protein